MRGCSLIIIFAIIVGSCRSSDKKHNNANIKKSSTASTQETDAIESSTKTSSSDKFCKSRPTLTQCCAALIPSCNECRQKNAKTQEAWEKRCLKEAQEVADCRAGAPVAECCPGPYEDCRACRHTALQKLLAWKSQCANIDAHSCDRQPPQDVCCQALIPSCNRCRARNQRIAEEWRTRCQSPPVAKPQK